ncbi:MAG: serine/threonine protein kinase [Deltaproteobacteria bacterium]|nr:serine/threonine protein kinase [Deltaproteobacteria bacterium]
MAPAPRQTGYQVGFPLGSGGMATVRYGRRVAAGGFAHAVAIKELHPHLAGDPQLAAMFLDEARLAARVVHPNVVSILDVVSEGAAVWAVMQYVEGESLARLSTLARARSTRAPARVAVAIVIDVLAGLAAAHRATDERGQSLGIVHRDISPQNVMVGVDGVARVLDFGVAKANGRLQETRDGQVKGKLSYMAPEQLGGEASVVTDVYAVAIVLWELLAGRRLFEASTDLELMRKVLDGASSRPSEHAEVPPAIDDLVMTALASDPTRRFASAAEMGEALATAADGAVATRAEVGAWVESLADAELAQRRRAAAEMVDVAPEVWSAAPGPGREVFSQTFDPVTSTLVLPPAAPVTPAAPAAPARSSSRWPRFAAVAVAALAIGAGSATAARSLGPSVAPVAAARAVPPPAAAPVELPSPSTSTAASVSVSPSPSPVLAAASPVPVARGVRTGPAAAKAPTASSHASSRVPPTADPHASPGSPVAPPSRTDESCDPPFVVDANGVRQYKRACIR